MFIRATNVFIWIPMRVKNLRTQKNAINMKRHKKGLAPRSVEIRRLSGDLVHAPSSID